MHRHRMFSQPWLRTIALWGAVSLIASVQRSTITVNSGVSTTATATINAVDTSRSVISHLGATWNAAASDEDSAFLRLELTNSTTVTARRNTATTNVSVLSFDVVQLMPGVLKSIQRGTVVGNSTASITRVVTGRTRLDALGFTVAAPGDLRCLPRLALTNGTTVTQTVDAGDGSTTTSAFQAAEWW